MARVCKLDPQHPYTRAYLKSILRLLPGGKITVGRDRNPSTLTETKTVVSEVDPETEFTIKKASNREDVQRTNLFAKVEYVTDDEDGTIITRRDFPVGDLQLETIQLCLIKWNIEDGGRAVPITRQTMLDYLRPEERVQLYQEVLDFNPIWNNREQAKS